MIQLDIVSDPICPWCYIGKANLDAATKAKDLMPFEVFWRPFQLNPDMPEGGMDRRKYLELKFGEDRATSFYKQIEDAATNAGLDVRFDLIERTPNTFDAHRLIRWSRSAGAQTAVVDDLFIRYFQKGEDLGDRDMLVEVGVAHGLERDVLKRLYETDADRETLQTEETTAREIGVNGVPTFIIANKHVVTGAQPPAMWETVLDELAEQIKTQKSGEGAAPETAT